MRRLFCDTADQNPALVDQGLHLRSADVWELGCQETVESLACLLLRYNEFAAAGQRPGRLAFSGFAILVDFRIIVHEGGMSGRVSRPAPAYSCQSLRFCLYPDVQNFSRPPLRPILWLGGWALCHSGRATIERRPSESGRRLRAASARLRRETS